MKSAINKSLISDNYARQFEYLRLSITDQCNFRCTYCLPKGYQKPIDFKQNLFLTQDEIMRIVKVFARLGFWKVRITGGEPTIRKDFINIVEAINDMQSIKKIALTTNGYKLEQKAKSYYQAGIKAINISLDSLEQKQFAQITGHNLLQPILKGLDKCLEIGFTNIKINIVLMKNINNQNIDQFIEFVKDKPISLRFIELMQTGDNLNFFNQYHCSAQNISEKISTQGWQISARKNGDGPAKEYQHPNYLGKIGIIAPYSKNFCANCNRLRVSARGDLYLCLFDKQGFSLRKYLKNDNQFNELKQFIENIIYHKKPSHLLHLADFGNRVNLSTIGG